MPEENPPVNSVENKPLYLRDVERQIEKAGTVICTTDDIDTLVEIPLREACKTFFIKNIKTYQTSANKSCIGKDNGKKDTWGHPLGYVWIDFYTDSLYPENVRRLKEMGYENPKRIETISMKVSKNTRVREIEDYFDTIVKKLGKQKYGSFAVQSYEYWKKMAFIESDEIKDSEEEKKKDWKEHIKFNVERGLFYDSETDALYINEGQYRVAIGLETGLEFE